MSTKKKWVKPVVIGAVVVGGLVFVLPIILNQIQGAGEMNPTLTYDEPTTAASRVPSSTASMSRAKMGVVTLQRIGATLGAVVPW